MASIARMSKSGAFLQRPETIPKYDIDVIDPVRVLNPHRTTHIAFPRPDADDGPKPPPLQRDTSESDREVGDYSPAERTRDDHADPVYVENGSAAPRTDGAERGDAALEPNEIAAGPESRSVRTRARSPPTSVSHRT
jgi:hypothetical protein